MQSNEKLEFFNFFVYYYLHNSCTAQNDSKNFNEINICLHTIHFRFIEYKTKSSKEKRKKENEKTGMKILSQ